MSSAQSASRTPADSPFVVNIHDLGRRLGDTMVYQDVLSYPSNLGVGMAWVPAESPMTIDVTLQSVGEGVRLVGRLTADVEYQCARCLEEFSDYDVFDLEDFFFWSSEGHDPDGDDLFVVDETIDLSDTIIDEVVLKLPFAPLCREDCLGLCQECGTNLNDDPDHNHGEKVDQRWGKLVNLFGNDRAGESGDLAGDDDNSATTD